MAIFFFASAAVPDHTVTIDTSERLWITAKCSCGADFSRRKWTNGRKSATLALIEDADAHMRRYTPADEIAEYDPDWKPKPTEY